MNSSRADSFLRLIRRSQRGRLKIYLGYCAGVGKTYQMLLEARRLAADGIDVVAGLVETHGRKDTEQLLGGLEIVPRRQVVYRGIATDEMDVDAILARHPAVVLVDELAHTNIPGSRNEKRHQDVEDLLSAGIHVITTLNVQHLESLYDTVERATGIKVRERIPDRIVAGADQLVNVDITSEDLRQRLKDGKVYTRERVEVALDHFFRATNLEQLRELTLRELAAQLDSRQRDTLAEATASAPDQVMVCLSSRGPNSEALLRYASRLAGRLNRNWYAVYVQTSSESPTMIDAATQRALGNTLALAQQLGATVFTYKGDDVVRTILQFAGEYRVGHIVVGSPGNRLSYWDRLLGRQGIIERLVQEGHGVTVVALDTRSVAEAPKPSAGEKAAGPPKGLSVRYTLPSSFWRAVPVLMFEEPTEKLIAIRQLLEACVPGEDPLCREAWQRLVEREKQGGTFVGEELAIPHARVANLREPRVALAVARQGIYDPEAGRRARIMVLLLSPETPPDIHVSLLGAISRMALNDQWRRDMQLSGSAAEARKVLRAWTSAAKGT